MLHEIVQWFERAGASIALLALTIGIFGGAVYAAHLTEKRTRNRWLIWGAGILTFVLLSLIFGSTYQAVKRATCYGIRPFQSCVDGDDDGAE